MRFPQVSARGMLAVASLVVGSVACRSVVTDDGTGLDLPGDADAERGGLADPSLRGGDYDLDFTTLGYHPRPEPCDGVDNDRDGDIDEGYADTDGDGTADCVDNEECDGLDNDGDGSVDEGLACEVKSTCATEYAATGHAVWLPGISTSLVADAPLSWTTYSDGTATLTGTVTDGVGSFDVDVSFSGYTGTAPASSPKLELPSTAYVSGGGAIDPSTWEYYTSFSGDLTGAGGYAGGAIKIAKVGPAFQVGAGANGKDADDGGSGWFDYSVMSTPAGLSWPAGNQGDLNLDFAECGEECLTFDLGEAANWNVFVCDFYRFGLDVRGRVAVGDRLEMTSFSVGQDTPGGTVIVADRLVLNSGTVHGDAYYGDYAVIGSDVTFASGGSARQGMPIDFEAECEDLEDLSDALSELPANGTTTVFSWKGVDLTGTDPDINVFDLDRDALWAAVQLDITAPAGSIVVINVPGTEPKMQEFGIFLHGVDETTVLWNFYEAEKLIMGSIGVRGTVLAPTADICFDNGNFDGTIIGRSLGGDAEGHWFPFGGPFEVCADGEDEGDTGIPGVEE
jgi:choice-of-anchor A domain-containing protein